MYRWQKSEAPASYSGISQVPRGRSDDRSPPICRTRFRAEQRFGASGDTVSGGCECPVGSVRTPGAPGVPASEADDLVAGAQCEVVELDGMVPASRVCCVHGRLGQRRDGGVRGPGSIAGRDWPHGTAADRAGRLSCAHFADVGSVNGRTWGGWRGSSGSPCCRAPIHTPRRGAGCWARPVVCDGKPGWRRAGASIWNGSGAACVPHTAIEGPQE